MLLIKYISDSIKNIITNEKNTINYTKIRNKTIYM